MKNYYEILGVDSSASQDVIKKEFRKLAQKYHPDKEGGDESKFKEINEAYSVLSNPDKRRQYDMGGSATAQGFEGFSDFEDMFSQFFGGNSFHSRQRKSRVVNNYGNLENTINLDLSLAEVYDGVSKQVEIQYKDYCTSCNGFGADLETCKTCKGSGTQVQQQGFFSVQTTCRSCSGYGRTRAQDTDCTSCKGKGFELKKEQVSLDLPPGSGHVHQQVRLNMPNYGHKAQGVRGPLVVNIKTKFQEDFRQQGLDLFTSSEVSFTDLLLGSNLEVKLPNGTSKRMKLKPTTNLAESYRFKGMGMSQPGSRLKGDLLVSLKLTAPSSLSEKQKDLVDQLRKTGM